MKLNVAKELKATGWERVYAAADPEGKRLTFSREGCYFLSTPVIQPGSRFGTVNSAIFDGPDKYYFARGTTILHSAETPELLLTKIKLLGLL